MRLRDLLMAVKGKFMLSYNDSPAIRELYEGQSGIQVFAYERLDSIAQRAEPGKMYKELLIANYDMAEHMKCKTSQLSIFDSTEGWEE
jgi:DNA adenine methylase